MDAALGIGIYGIGIFLGIVFGFLVGRGYEKQNVSKELADYRWKDDIVMIADEVEKRMKAKEKS